VSALALLLFLTAAVGAAFAWVIYRADPRRWDNRVFAAIVALDACMSVLRMVVVAQGGSLTEVPVMRLCGSISSLQAYLVFEFAWAFPGRPEAPRWARLAVLAATLGNVLWMNLTDWFSTYTTFVFFMPLFLGTMALLFRSYRRATRADAAAVRLVIVAMLARWLSAMTAYAVAQRIDQGFFSGALIFEGTAAVLLSEVLIGYAVVSANLFSVRGFVAEALVHAVLALAVVAATAAAVEGVLRHVADAAVLRVLLVAVAFLPLALVLGSRELRARLGTRVLAPLDPRRALRQAILERIVHGEAVRDPRDQVGLVCGALAEVTVGGSARFLGAPGRAAPGTAGELAAADAARLASPAVAHVAREDGSALLVPVRAGEQLFGALEVSGGQLDRDSLLAGTALANHLAVKLENHALFAELEESRRLATLGSFAAAIAHDIRTPLASVQMNVQILRGKVQLPADDMEHFDIALEELARLNGAIAQLLDYAKPVRLAAAALEVREIADDAARGIAPVLSERRVSLELEIAAGLPPVRADAQRIRQVLLNLLDNAAKASQPGAAVVLRSAAADGGRVAIEVADRGRGIAATDLPRIFEPFYTTRPDGTGLGLAIVQKIVRAHSGDVLVRSIPGQGSSFTVLLPAVAGSN
jgi:signal transduction histidine kinase